MADITFSGLATGLDTGSIVEQMMELERAPIDRLEAQKESEAARLQAFKQFDERLEGLREAVGAMNLTSEVRASSINLSSSAPFTASSSGANRGSYDVAVKQLAQVQKSVSSGFASQTDAVLENGTFSIGSTSITVDEDNNSLIGLQEAINALADETGVRATIINDGTESDTAYHLVFTGQDANTGFEISTSLMSVTQTRAAQQAKVEIDGIEVVSDSNTLSGVIPGVDLHLNSVSDTVSAEGVEPVEYATSLMTVEPDTAALKEKIQTFVDSYNSVMDWISAGYDEFGASLPSEDDIASGEEDVLSDLVRGDSSVNGVKRQLQGLLSTQIDTSGSLAVLSQLGISTQRDGSVALNESTLDTALSDKFDDVVLLLSGEGAEPGVMKKFNTALLDITGAGTGLYAEKKDSYTEIVNGLDEQIDRMEMLVDKREETMLSQFNALELLVSQMNTQSDFLTQQMDALSEMMSGGN